MIAATYTQDAGFRIEDVPLPNIGEDELLLRVMASSICGTDLRIIHSGHRKLAPGQKIILGHEFSGVVARVGSRAGPFQVGQRMGVAPNMGCGRCEACAQGMPNLCPDYTAFGITLDGAHTKYVRIPPAAIAQGSVMPLPPEVSFAEAALLEPLSCVVNSHRATRIDLGDTVVVFGAGPIGLLHLMLAQCAGAGAVLVVDVQPHRLARAHELGATSTLDAGQEDVPQRVRRATEGRGADVVITACSIASVQEQALELLAPFGRVCFFGGLPRDGSKVFLDTNLIHYKQLQVTGTTGGAPRDFRTALKLVASGRIDLKRVVSHVFPPAEMARAFDTALHQETMKVVMHQEENGP
jgi:L-iditol 2-dehydrogenase